MNLLFFWFLRLDNLQLNYLAVAKAAAFCSAHFSVIHYAELWCRQQISNNIPADGQMLGSGFNLLDQIYENVPEDVGVTLNQILQTVSYS